MSRARGRGSLENYVSMASRILRGASRGYLDVGTLEDLPAVLDLAAQAEAVAALAVRGMRNRGASWRDIGNALDMSGENARQRWGRVEDLPLSAGVYGLRRRGSTVYSYIGQAVSIAARIESYRRGRAHSLRLREWMLGEGHDFEVDVLEHCERPSDLNGAESRWIAQRLAAGDPLLNHVVPRGATGVAYISPPLREYHNGRTGRQCPKTEMRWSTGRSRPKEVRCTLLRDHEGVCVHRKIPFGVQPAESAYSRYMLKARGLVVTLDDPDGSPVGP